METCIPKEQKPVRHVSLPSIRQLQRSVLNFKAGNVKNCAHEWELITSDKFLLDMVSKGVPMVFESTPVCKFDYHSTLFSASD